VTPSEQRQRIASLEQAAKRLVDVADRNRDALRAAVASSPSLSAHEIPAAIAGLRAVLDVTSAQTLAAAWRDEPLEGGSGS
jgi:hypothetical protein